MIVLVIMTINDPQIATTLLHAVANSHTAPHSAQRHLRQLRNDGIQLSHRQQTELLLCSRHHRNLHIAAADLFLHDLLECGRCQDLCLCHRHALVVLILQVRLCAFAAAADGFGVIARECAGWVEFGTGGGRARQRLGEGEWMRNSRQEKLRWKKQQAKRKTTKNTGAN